MPIAFLPDTNAYLHYQALDDVDWRALAGDQDVVLLVALEVVNELDDHKLRKETGRRAQSILKRIKELLGNNRREGLLRNGVPAIFYPGRLTPDEMLAQHLDPTKADDRIIGQALHYRAAGADRELRLVTHDTGMNLHALGHGLVSQEMPDTLKISLGEDETAKALRRLEEQVAAHHRTIPNLKLSFPDGRKVCSYRLGPLPETEDMRRAVRWAEMAWLNPNNATVDELVSKYGEDAIGRYLRDGVETVIPALEREFRDYLRNWHFEFKEYLEEKYAEEMRRGTTIELTLHLRNEGGRPAGQTDVTLTFFQEVQIAFPAVEPKSVPAPTDPSFKAMRDRRLEKVYLNAMRGRADLTSTVEAPATGSVRLVNARNETSVTASFEIVPNKDHVVIGPITIAYASRDAMQNGAIGYKVRSNSLPDVIEGELHLVFECS